MSPSRPASHCPYAYLLLIFALILSRVQAEKPIRSLITFLPSYTGHRLGPQVTVYRVPVSFCSQFPPPAYALGSALARFRFVLFFLPHKAGVGDEITG